MDWERKNVIVELSFEFSLAIMRFAEELVLHKKFVLADQVLKSGTSIGANVAEAQSAESKRDFIHKLKVAMKEANETRYWLLLCQRSENYPFDENLIVMLENIIKVLNSIITTTRKKYQISIRE